MEVWYTIWGKIKRCSFDRELKLTPNSSVRTSWYNSPLTAATMGQELIHSRVSRWKITLNHFHPTNFITVLYPYSPPSVHPPFRQSFFERLKAPPQQVLYKRRDISTKELLQRGDASSWCDAAIKSCFSFLWELKFSEKLKHPNFVTWGFWNRSLILNVMRDGSNVSVEHMCLLGL